MKRSYWRYFGLLSLSLFVFSTALHAQTGARAECFPFEKLSFEQRAAAEELLLKALDGEALYTIVGGLKPMSSGFQSVQLPVQLPRVTDAEAGAILGELAGKNPEELNPDEKRRLGQAKQADERRKALEKVAATRAIFEHWRCGNDEIFADVHHYAQTYEGKRYLDTIVFSRSSLRQVIGAKANFFSRWGITVNSHPLEVLYAVEHDETNARFGGYGFLFGYPDYAVEFFVKASDEEKFSGKFVERDFISLPTVAGENRFVYVVAKGHAQNETDKTLRAKAERIFNEYTRRRAEYIGTGKKGVVEMLRDWFCTSANQCSPAAAKIN